MFDVILSAAKNLLIYRDSSPPNGCQVQNDNIANIMFAFLKSSGLKPIESRTVICIIC